MSAQGGPGTGESPGRGRGAEELLAGRYRLGGTPGAGTMGTVRRAVDTALDRDVAVKEVTVSGLPPEELTALYSRILRTARAAAGVRHVNAVTVFDVLEQDGRPWIVMELVDGRSLADVLSGEGTLRPRDAARLAQPLLGALQQAHRVGVLHGDVTPASVLLEHSGRVVLTGFGLAVFEGPADLARIVSAVGSAAYVAPELAEGPPGPPSDLWSLGATLYSALEGAPPFRRATDAETLRAVAADPLPQPRHAGPLTPVIEALLRKDPDQRPDAEQARRMLADAVAGPSVTATQPITPPPSPPPPPPPPPQRVTRETRPPPTVPVPAPVPVPAAGGTGPGGQAPHPPGAPAGNRPRRKARIRALITAASLLLALIGGGLTVWKLTSSPHHAPQPVPSTAPSTPPSAPPAPPAPAQPPNGTPAAAPQQVVQDYYAAISNRDYRRAWDLGGKNLGGSYEEFAKGFATTASDSVTVTSVSGNTVGVQLDATQTDGSHRYFSGTFTVNNGEIVSAAVQRR
ncbi:serine/threonine-protein kinase [Streptomyces nondiastaticus]|uniref:non-specific serine/threonine protein kinase n=1 Tax=Streptomyces nondiastaticus TaxID=3154512 RepID=A0ABW6TSW9_9ACTN